MFKTFCVLVSYFFTKSYEMMKSQLMDLGSAHPRPPPAYLSLFSNWWSTYGYLRFNQTFSLIADEVRKIYARISDDFHCCWSQFDLKFLVLFSIWSPLICFFLFEVFENQFLSERWDSGLFVHYSSFLEKALMMRQLLKMLIHYYCAA
jgi:hypothetical protein